MEPCGTSDSSTIPLLIGYTGAEINVVLAHGNDRALRFQVLIDGVAQDITDYVIVAEIWKYKQDIIDITKSPVLTWSYEVNDPVNGRFIISLQETLINTLRAGACLDHPDSIYYWRMRMEAPAVDPANAVTTPLAFGKVFVQI